MTDYEYLMNKGTKTGKTQAELIADSYYICYLKTGEWEYHISCYPLKWRNRPGGFDLTDLEDIKLLGLYKDVHHRCKYWKWTC